MNKKLLSLAVAGAIAVPMAAPVMVSTASADEGTGPTVYGRVRLGLQRDEVAADGNNWGLENDSSRVGIKGTEDLGNDMSVFYRYEFGVNTTAEDNGDSAALTRRHSYVGLQGNFGAISAGRQTTSYYALTGSNYALGNSYTGNYLIYEDNTDTSDKASDSIRWQKSFGDLTVGADMILDQDDQSNDINGISAAAEYDLGVAKVFGGYNQKYQASVAEDESAERLKSQIWTVGVSANLTDSIAVFGIYEDGSFDNRTTGVDTDGEAVHAGISMDITDKIDGFFIYDYIDASTSSDIFTIGSQYHISDRTRFYAEAEFKSNDSADDTDKQIVGIRHDF